MNKIDLYSTLRSILRLFIPWKWVFLGCTLEGGSKIPNFFTRIRWNMLSVLLINMAIISYITLSKDIVLLIEG